MGFLAESSKAPSVYLEVTEDGKLTRPLAIKPQSIWVHKVQEVKTVGPDGKPIILRKFQHETCTATGRGGAGCFLCNTPDPLWHMLPKDEQENRSGKRVDFPKTPVHMLPVYDHTAMDVYVLKGGNQIFELMDQWYDAQPQQQQDLRRCDWRVSKKGQGKRTQYTSVRMDATVFQVTQELENKAKAALARALEDRRPTDPAKLMQIIKGEVGGMALPESTAPVTAALPAQQMYALPPVTATVTFPQVSTPMAPSVATPVVTPVATPVLTAQPGQAANRSLIDEFSSWISCQPEFQGLGAIQNLVPILKEKFGHVEYHRLSAEQIDQLKTFLNEKLTSLRLGRK